LGKKNKEVKGINIGDHKLVIFRKEEYFASCYFALDGINQTHNFNNDSLPALVLDLFTFSSKVINSFIIIV
jgi:hypothetical protein